MIATDANQKIWNHPAGVDVSRIPLPGFEPPSPIAETLAAPLAVTDAMFYYLLDDSLRNIAYRIKLSGIRIHGCRPASERSPSPGEKLQERTGGSRKQ